MRGQGWGFGRAICGMTFLLAVGLIAGVLEDTDGTPYMRRSDLRRDPLFDYVKFRFADPTGADAF